MEHFCLLALTAWAALPELSIAWHKHNNFSCLLAAYEDLSTAYDQKNYFFHIYSLLFFHQKQVFRIVHVEHREALLTVHNCEAEVWKNLQFISN